MSRFVPQLKRQPAKNETMSWANAKKIADEWIAKNLPYDLRGSALQLPSFQSDEDCRMFYADRDLAFHRMITNAIARTARKRGVVEIIWLPVTKESGLIMDADRYAMMPERTKFIESCYRILPARV